MNGSHPQILRLLLITALALLLTGPVLAARVPPDARDAARAELDAQAESTIQDMIERHPELEEALGNAVGWFAGRVSGAQVVALGGGYGAGVLFDAADQSRTYMNIRRLDLGAGLGGASYRVLVVVEDSKTLDRLRTGTWTTGLSGQSVVGESGGLSVSQGAEGYSVYFLAEGGAVAAVSARLVHLKVNHDLTDTGLGSVGIPVTGFDTTGRQDEGAPRRWDRPLPFMAQKVIDQGYDLPLPFGVGATFAAVEQDQLLEGLIVSIGDIPPTPLDWVTFENSVSDSRNASAKLSAWLFPFMQVYAMYGRLEGDATMDIYLDGNGMIDQIGLDCTERPTPPLCRLLEDRQILLPIRTSFEGNTYGIGAVLAGGWRGWFFTLPVNWTYADLETSEADGASFTATPRGGRLFDLGNAGTLALFAGGNYLDSDLTITGNYLLGGIDINYQIDQQNADAWNLLLGANWDITRNLSVSVEYNGFIGSREAWIGSVTWNF